MGHGLAAVLAPVPALVLRWDAVFPLMLASAAVMGAGEDGRGRHPGLRVRDGERRRGGERRWVARRPLIGERRRGRDAVGQPEEVHGGEGDEHDS